MADVVTALFENHLQDQSVLVLGLGLSGLAMARWCTRMGARVMVVDTRAQPPQLGVLHSTLKQVQFVQSDFNAALVEHSEVRAVFVSPGLSPAQTQATLDAARARGLWIGSELSLFAQALAGLHHTQQYVPKVLAITGTNGKTTVTSLTTHLLRWAGKTVAMAGNIGPTLLDTLMQAIDNAALPEFWVLELSSFQLELPSEFSPSAATVLNLSQNHLDWHGTMQAYTDAKGRIFGNGLMVLNRDDDAVMALRPEPVRAKLQRPKEREVLLFGMHMPQRPGDFGIEDVNGMAWLVRALEADETHKPRGAAQEPLHIQRLMPADALRIRGRHNASNALAALALCCAGGCNLAPLLFGLREYRGEPHRVESVGVVDGVEYFDDSKGTNIGATVAALTSLGSERKVVLILGGLGKGQDFAALEQPVARFARAVVLIGRDAPIIEAALATSQVPLHHAHSMPEAVAQGERLSHSGDVVLLSPACASFDMFESYEHRGDSFRHAVQELALAKGYTLEASV